MTYHDLCSSPADETGLRIAQERFASHVRFLLSHYTVLPLGAALRRVSSQIPLAEDIVAVTFDDGYRSNFDLAWPVLSGANSSATFFLTSSFLDGEPLWFDLVHQAADRLWASSAEDRESAELRGWLQTRLPGVSSLDLVGRLKRCGAEQRRSVVRRLGDWYQAREGSEALARPMSWSQVRSMAESGAEFGSHTVNHPILSDLPPELQKWEIETSAMRLEEEIRPTERLFAYPNGKWEDFDSSTVRFLRELGFRAAVTTLVGSNRSVDDRFLLRRVGVWTDSVPVLAIRMSGLLDQGRARADTAGVTSRRSVRQTMDEGESECR